jgi:hypothetical protein
MIDKAKGKPKYDSWSQQHALMKAIGFTQDDLDANRGGYMSKKQRAALSHERQFWLNSVAIIIGGTAILYTFILSKSIIEGSQFYNSLTTIAFLSVISAGLLMYMGFQRSLVNADLRKGDVYVAEGLVSLHITEYKNKIITDYQVYIREQERHFNVGKAVFDAFIDGDPYAIYYAPHSKTFLSAEWLGSG